MTAQPLAPVIPSSAVPAARRRARPGAGLPLPLARPARSAPQDVVYGIARIDASGRICERAVITALRWADGDHDTRDRRKNPEQFARVRTPPAENRNPRSEGPRSDRQAHIAWIWITSSPVVFAA